MSQLDKAIDLLKKFNKLHKELRGLNLETYLDNDGTMSADTYLCDLDCDLQDSLRSATYELTGHWPDIGRS